MSAPPVENFSTQYQIDTTNDVFKALKLRANLDRQYYDAVKESVQTGGAEAVPPATLRNQDLIEDKFAQKDRARALAAQVMSADVANDFVNWLDSNGDIKGYLTFGGKFADEFKDLHNVKFNYLKGLWNGFKNRIEKLAESEAISRPLGQAAYVAAPDLIKPDLNALQTAEMLLLTKMPADAKTIKVVSQYIKESPAYVRQVFESQSPDARSELRTRVLAAIGDLKTSRRPITVPYEYRAPSGKMYKYGGEEEKGEYRPNPIRDNLEAQLERMSSALEPYEMTLPISYEEYKNLPEEEQRQFRSKLKQFYRGREAELRKGPEGRVGMSEEEKERFWKELIDEIHDPETGQPYEEFYELDAHLRTNKGLLTAGVKPNKWKDIVKRASTAIKIRRALVDARERLAAEEEKTQYEARMSKSQRVAHEAKMAALERDEAKKRAAYKKEIDDVYRAQRGLDKEAFDIIKEMHEFPIKERESLFDLPEYETKSVFSGQDISHLFEFGSPRHKDLVTQAAKDIASTKYPAIYEPSRIERRILPRPEMQIERTEMPLERFEIPSSFRPPSRRGSMASTISEGSYPFVEELSEEEYPPELKSPIAPKSSPVLSPKKAAIQKKVYSHLTAVRTPIEHETSLSSPESSPKSPAKPAVIKPAVISPKSQSQPARKQRKEYESSAERRGLKTESPKSENYAELLEIYNKQSDADIFNLAKANKDAIFELYKSGPEKRFKNIRLGQILQKNDLKEVEEEYSDKIKINNLTTELRKSLAKIELAGDLKKPEPSGHGLRGKGLRAKCVPSKIMKGAKRGKGIKKGRGTVVIPDLQARVQKIKNDSIGIATRIGGKGMRPAIMKKEDLPDKPAKGGFILPLLALSGILGDM